MAGLKSHITAAKTLTDALAVVLLLGVVFVISLAVPWEGLGARVAAFAALIGVVFVGALAEGWIFRTKSYKGIWTCTRFVAAVILWLTFFLPLSAMQEAGKTSRLVWMTVTLAAIVSLLILAAHWTRYEAAKDLVLRVAVHLNSLPLNKRGASDVAQFASQYSDISEDVNALYPGFDRVVLLFQWAAGLHPPGARWSNLEELLEASKELRGSSNPGVVGTMKRLFLARLALDQSSQGENDNMIRSAIEYYSWISPIHGSDGDQLHQELKETGENLGARIDLYCALRFESAQYWDRSRFGPYYGIAASAEQCFERAGSTFDSVSNRTDASPFSRARATNNRAYVLLRRLSFVAKSAVMGKPLSQEERRFLQGGDQELRQMLVRVQSCLKDSRMPETALTICQMNSQLAHSAFEQCKKDAELLRAPDMTQLQNRLDECVHFLGVSCDLGLERERLKGQTHSLGFCWLLNEEDSYATADPDVEAKSIPDICALVAEYRGRFLRTGFLAPEEATCHVCKR